MKTLNFVTISADWKMKFHIAYHVEWEFIVYGKL